MLILLIIYFGMCFSKMVIVINEIFVELGRKLENGEMI